MLIKSFDCKAKRNNTPVSGNAGDKKNLHPGGLKKETLAHLFSN